MDQPSLLSFRSFETRFPINADVAGLPFKRQLSLAPLAAAWRDAGLAAGVAGALARHVEEELRTVPELLAPIEDLAVIARHRALVDVLMSRAFPAAFWEQDYAAALTPFALRAFYATPSFARLLLDEDGTLRGQLNLDEQSWAAGRLQIGRAHV